MRNFLSATPKAALVHPHDMKYHREREEMNAVSHVEGTENFPNLALLTIASLFGPEWELSYIDEDYLTQNGLTYSYLGENFDLVCLTAMNHQSYQAYRIADFFRKRGIYTVMGGMHASALPEEALMHVDSVIVGEGEDAFPRFLEDFMKGTPQKVYYSSGKVDLTQVPPPRFDILPNPGWFDKYPLFATRGCPRNCEFCCLGEVYGPIYRKKSPQQVADEIRMIQSIVKDPFISFADENMLADRTWSKELAKALKPLNIKWEAYCDISAARDEEMLELLRESGCVELIIGFETISKENMQTVDNWKASQIAGYPEAIKTIQSHDIGILACFVVGFDHDNEETFDNLISFLEENPVFELDIAVLTPMPGTRLHSRLKKENRLYPEKWDDYTWYHINFEPAGLKPDQIKKGIMRVFDSYSSPMMEEKRRKMFASIEARLPDENGRNIARCN
ncbi:MAG: B12-binding domain-containing radical SAM protein [Firmicutes bacterium]|nr:B12-binding domain-containing radical SAM protein [Bacillota bacterium]